MKRILIALFLILSIVICLPACDLFNTELPIEENPDFAAFNAMFDKTFDNYTIIVTTTSANNDVLNNKYVVTTENGVRSVAYVIETLNSFVIEGDKIIAPDSYKTVSAGTYDATTSASEKFNVPKFNFSYRCIANDIITPATFKADIFSLSGFMGLEESVTDAEFRLNYSKENVELIETTYVTENGSTVVISYVFN